MSERDTTGTVNRQQSLIRARGRGWQGRENRPRCRHRDLLRVKFGLTVPPYWSKTSSQGWKTMSVRATSLAFLFGAMVLGGASAAERPDRAAPPAPAAERCPGGERGAARRRRHPDAHDRRSQPEDRRARLHPRQSLSGGDGHAAGHLPAPAQDRGGGARPDQGVSFRPRHAGRLAHRHRSRASRAGREGLRDRGRQRPAGASRPRPRGQRPRRLHARHRGRGPSAGAPARNRRPTPRRPAIRARWW